MVCYRISYIRPDCCHLERVSRIFELAEATDEKIGQQVATGELYLDEESSLVYVCDAKVEETTGQIHEELSTKKSVYILSAVRL